MKNSDFVSSGESLKDMAFMGIRWNSSRSPLVPCSIGLDITKTKSDMKGQDCGKNNMIIMCEVYLRDTLLAACGGAFHSNGGIPKRMVYFMEKSIYKWMMQRGYPHDLLETSIKHLVDSPLG